MAEHVATPPVADLIERLADNKQLLGRQYAAWCSSAPTLEAAVAAAAMAQDELGHARALYPLLRTLTPEAGPENDPETRTHLRALSFLQRPFAGWEDFVTANFLIDRALTLVFASAQHSSFEALAGRSRKVLQEEQTHTLHGDAWVRKLAREGTRVREALRQSMLLAWDEVLCWFGPEGETGDLTVQGILDASPDVLRSRFLAQVAPVLRAEEIDMPVQLASDGSWALSVALPWHEWNGYQLSDSSAKEASAASFTASASAGEVSHG